MEEDSKIIDLLYKREEQALIELSEKYGTACKRIAGNILKNHRDAEECVNDTYLAVWNTIPPKNPNPLRAYIFRIIRNISIAKYHENTCIKRNSYYDVALQELENCLMAVMTVEQEMEANELSDLLDGFLETLDKRSRIMFVRRYWYSDSISDLAERFQISNNNVSVRLSRIRGKLKRYLKKEGVRSMRKKDITDAIGNINDRYIEEAADFQRKKKRTGKSSILQKSVAAAASFILVFILSVSTLVAADFSPAYEFLYTLSPSAAQKLKPVSMISEDNGIKIEVISAYVESGEAKILISVQDLEEDRIDETTDLFDSFSINTSFDCSSSCENIKYDAETETAVFLISISQWDKYDIADEKITFSVREILSNKETYEGSISTLNLDKNSGSVKIFTPYSVLGGSGANSEKYMEDFQALVSQGDINSPVSGVALTAIGYVGEKLHIQIRYDSALETDNHGYVYLKNSDGDVLDCEASISFFTDEGEKDMYSEYIFDLSDKNVSDYVIYGKFTTSNMHIKGKWSVTFPLEKVR